MRQVVTSSESKWSCDIPCAVPPKRPRLEDPPRPTPTGEKRRQEEDTEHTEEEQGEAIGH